MSFDVNQGGNTMDPENAVKENLETLFQKLEKFLKTETVVGQPIVIGETTLVPIVSISFGCATGAGGGTGNDPKTGSGSGSGSGLSSAAKITPAAMLVIKNGEVTMLPIKDKWGWKI
jgi:uncharacterized spore protein YtfJ